jgi:cell division protease FtsH
MSNLGNLSSSYGNHVVEECKNLVDSLYEDTLKILKSNIDILKELAVELMEKETLEEKDLIKFKEFFINKKIS